MHWTCCLHLSAACNSRLFMYLYIYTKEKISKISSILYLVHTIKLFKKSFNNLQKHWTSFLYISTIYDSYWFMYLYFYMVVCSYVWTFITLCFLIFKYLCICAFMHSFINMSLLKKHYYSLIPIVSIILFFTISNHI